MENREDGGRRTERMKEEDEDRMKEEDGGVQGWRGGGQGWVMEKVDYDVRVEDGDGGRRGGQG